MSREYWIYVACLICFPWFWAYFRIFVVTPWKLRKGTPMRLVPHFEETRADELTPDVRRRLGQVLAQFAAEGFSVAANLQSGGAAAGVRSFEVVLVNHERRQVGSVIAAGGGTGQNWNFVFAVRTLFADGTSVVTSVNPSLTPGPKDPTADAMSFPWVTDVATVCELHRRRLEKSGKSKLRGELPIPGGEIEYLTDIWTKTIDRWVRAGYRWVDQPAGLARKTLKGAYLTTWKLSPPVKGWLLKRREKQARRVWRTLGMDRWNGSRPAVAVVPMMEVAVNHPLVPPMETSGPLQYQTELRPGDIRWTWDGRSVTVVCRNATVGATLLARTFDLIMLVVWSLLLCFDALAWYLGWFRIHAGTLVLLVFYGFSIWRVTKALLRAGGTANVIATPGLLRFHAVPSLPRSGEIRTEQLTGLFIVKTKPTIGAFQIRLEARRHAAKAVVLLVSPDFEAVVAARKELAVGLGIDHRTPAGPVGSAYQGNVAMKFLRLCRPGRGFADGRWGACVALAIDRASRPARFARIRSPSDTALDATAGSLSEIFGNRTEASAAAARRRPAGVRPVRRVRRPGAGV